MMNEPVIVDAVRSPMGRGKAGGALSGVHPSDLLAAMFRAIVERNRIDPGEVDDLIVGCVSQVGEQSATPGRMAWLSAGFPAHVPATTIDRKCGSSQQAVHFAAQGVMAGVYDMVIAAGIESMSRIPLGSARLGQDYHGPAVTRRFAPGLVSQGVSAELVAAKWGLTREDLDRYSADSHSRAAAVAAQGGFDQEIVPIFNGQQDVRADETIRPDTTAEKLGALKAVFGSPDMIERFPEIDWKVTAGNSSQITDGAAALLIMSLERAKALGLEPRARFVAFDVIGDDPMMMLTAPIPAAKRVLSKAGLKIDDIAHCEVNEAFASVPLAWQRELDADPARINPCGGAIALGHPLGATGARLMTTMLGVLERTGGRYGLQAVCEAGGMANATIIERL